MKNTRTKQTPIQRAMKIVTSITLLAMLFVLVLAGTLSGAFGVEENLVQNGSIQPNVANAAVAKVGAATTSGTEVRLENNHNGKSNVAYMLSENDFYTDSNFSKPNYGDTTGYRGWGFYSGGDSGNNKNMLLPVKLSDEVISALANGITIKVFLTATQRGSGKSDWGTMCIYSAIPSSINTEYVSTGWGGHDGQWVTLPDYLIANQDAAKHEWNYDVPSTKIGLLRCWYENTATGGIETHLEIITKDYKKQFVDGIEKKVITENTEYKFEEVDGSNKPVRWTDLPCFAVENPYGMSFFENVVTLINKNEKVIENNANIFDYNDNAKLKVTGFAPTNDPLIPLLNEDGEEQKDKDGNIIMTKNPARVQEDETVLNAKVFYTPDKDGDIDWIIKDINDTASENHKKTCLDMALMISGVPNVTDQGFTDADNAAALEKKFFPLEQVLQQAHHLFRKEYLRMWEMITARINLKKGKEYDFRDIDVILIRNLPTDTESLTNAWLKLRGLVSDKSIISHLPFGLDAESELAEMDKQNQENIQKNLENMAEIEEKHQPKDINGKVGDISGNMEVSRPTNAENENNISKDKQTNSK